MLNVIVLLFLIVVSYLIFFIEKENFIISLVQAPFSNDIFENIKAKKNNTLFKMFNENLHISKNPNNNSETDLRIKLNQKSKNVDLKISMAREELNSNLKHLEFIMTIESQFEDLASKGRFALERLQEYVKIKREVQLKIIELSQTIAYYESRKINLC